MMNGPTSYRMREKSAAQMPAVGGPDRQPPPVDALMISAAGTALIKLLGIRPLAPHVPEHIPAAAHHIRLLASHFTIASHLHVVIRDSSDDQRPKLALDRRPTSHVLT
jgi:hypothetical protein